VVYAGGRVGDQRRRRQRSPDRPADQPAGGPVGHHRRQPPEPGRGWRVGVGRQPRRRHGDPHELASGKVLADIPVPSEPHRVAYGAGAAWVGNWHDNSVSRIDPHTNRVVGSPIPIGFHHAGNLVVGGSSVWVASDYRVDGAAEDVVVVRIDPQSNRAVETIAVASHPIDVAATAGAVWVSVADPGTVVRIAAR
jgi:DNA-binding beta-propeller fold protein YncE